jgi:hypothetical protein
MPTPATEAFPANRPWLLRRAPPTIGLITVGAVAIILVLLCADAARRGPWLDEFWTLQLSDRHEGFLALIRDGWLRDTHPPLFNLWATFLNAIGVASIPAARLATNLPAVGLMIAATLHFSRRLPEQAGFSAAMLLLTLSLPQSVDAFGDYRSYFWQIAALSTLTLIARYVVLTHVDLDIRKEAGLAIVAVLATVGSIALHYIGGLFGGLLAGAIAVSAIARGHWRWAALVLVTAALASLFVISAALLQAPNWASEFDVKWISSEGLEALAIPSVLVGVAICHNPVPLAGLWFARRRWTRPESVFIVMMAGVLLGGLAVVLVLNAFQPIVVIRYVQLVTVLVAAIMASLAVKFAHDWRLFGLLALVSVAAVAGPLAWNGISPEWKDGARKVERIVAECPTTQVYATSGWTLGEFADSHTALREDPVFERAHGLLAGQYGYTVHFIGQHGTAQAVLGDCPVLVLYEHSPRADESELRAALEAAGLKGLETARLSAIRTSNGFILRADRP